jgi:hypothetical protein
MFGEHEEMYQPMLEYLQNSETLLAVGNHTFLNKAWFEQSSFHLRELFHSADVKEQSREKAERVVQLVSDAYEMFLASAQNPDWKKLTLAERQSKVNELLARPQIEQRSEHWYIDAANYLTASEFSKLFGSARDVWELLQKKANPAPYTSSSKGCRTGEMRAFDWGIRFEPVIKQIIEKRESARVQDMGRLQHRHLARLAASPDGIIVEAERPEKVGRLVEIKCPYTRSIGKEIPFDYWVQMQIQMEVADVDECEYVEAILDSPRPDKPNWVAPEKKEDLLHGKVLLCSRETEMSYVYCPIGADTAPIPEGWKLEEEIPWSLNRMYGKIVYRDRTWFEATKVWQNLFWEDVERLKRGEAPSLPPPEERKKATPKCLIQDTSEDAKGENECLSLSVVAGGAPSS